MMIWTRSLKIWQRWESCCNSFCGPAQKRQRSAAAGKDSFLNTGENHEFSAYISTIEETIANLKIKPDGTYVDGTLGGAGHASEVCKRLSATGRFIGIDQDDAAIAAAGERLREFGERVTIIRSNYCNMVSRLQERGILGVDGILLDLGSLPIN